jgi:hypothetical protein
VLFAALAVGVSLPDHQYDYYAYFGLPAAALLASVPIAALVDWIGGFRRVPRVLVAVSAVVLAAGAWLQGGVLHASNAVVRRARHVELLAAVAERSPDRSTLYFVPPTGLAREDTLQGAAIAMLYPAKGLRIEFAGSPGGQDRFFAGPDLWLVATRSLAHGSWRADLLDQAQWRNPDSTLILSQSEELRQPFVPRGEVLTALQVAARWYGRGCEVAYTILRAPEGSTAGSPPALVSGGLIACRSSIAGDSADIALGSIPLVPGARYLLSLVVLSGALHLPVVRADDTGFEPLSRRIGDRWDVSPHTLGLRLVRDALER